MENDTKTISYTVDEIEEGTYVKLGEVQDRALKIYHQFFVMKWTVQEIADHHEVSTFTVRNSIKWVIDNKMKLPAQHLLEGAIDTLSDRIKKNQKLLDAEYSKTKGRDKMFIIALNKEIREDEKALFKLQQVNENSDKEVDDRLEAADVLKLIAAANKS